MIFVYIILLITSAIFYIQFEGAFSFYLFCFVVSYPIIFGLITYNVKRKLTVSFEKPELTGMKGSSIPVNIVIDNRSRLPVPNCAITISYYTDLGKRKEKVTIHTPVFPNNTQVLTTKFAYNHYGILSLEMTKIRIYDILKIIRFKVGGKRMLRKTKLIIYPNHIPLENKINDYSDLGLESENFSKSKKGDDPSEIFNIHEYAEGDKLSRVHWKLSAKQNEMMVKDYSLPITNGVMIAADFSHIPANGTELDKLDTIIDALSALSLRLAENEVTHTLMWCSNTEAGVSSYVVSDLESYTLAVRQLINGLSERSLQSFCDAVTELSTGAPKFAHTLVCTAKITQDEISTLINSGYSYRYTALVADNSHNSGYTEGYFSYLPIRDKSVAEDLELIAI